MTEEQVAIAIAVLTAYAAGQLRTDQCDELDEALIKAYQVWEEDAALEFEGDEGQPSLEWLEAQDRD